MFIHQDGDIEIDITSSANPVQFLFQDKATRDNISAPYSVTLSQNNFTVSQLLLTFIDGSFSDKILNEINSLLETPIKAVINHTVTLFLNHLVMPKLSSAVTMIWNVIDSGAAANVSFADLVNDSNTDVDLTMLSAGVKFLNDYLNAPSKAGSLNVNDFI